MTDRVALSLEPLKEQEWIDECRHSAAGALCSFIGTTRDAFQGQTVTRLEYEAYEPLALKTLRGIAQEARALALQGVFSLPSTTLAAANISPSHATPKEAQGLQRIAIVHRLGIVPPTETSILIVVSSAHRRESFAACEWILEAVKQRAQVWKKEVYQDGSMWKANHAA